VCRSDFVGCAEEQEREAMREAQGFGLSHLWAVAVLVAVTLLSLTGHGALSSQAAEDPPPVAPSDSGTSEDNTKQPDSSDDAGVEEANVEEANAEEASSDDSDEEGVSEESDPEVEEEPQEEETQEPPTKQEKDEDATPPKKSKRVIGATAMLLEKQSGLLFRARVDTGAKSCSLYVKEMVIEDEEEKWVDNIGKVVHFKVKNRSDETYWLEGRIAGYVIIKTSDSRVRRYKVPLILRWKGIEKKVLVTLNNRNGMKYQLLLGRNFLQGDFLVDVDIDNDD
jgi:hypothetical protein